MTLLKKMMNVPDFYITDSNTNNRTARLMAQDGHRGRSIGSYFVRRAGLGLAGFVLCVPTLAIGQSATAPASDPQALALASNAMAALIGRQSVTDVTMTGTVTWSTGEDENESGTATLRALGAGESRMDLALPEGTRSEIRDLQTGGPLGRWANPDNSSGDFAAHNCWTDAAWFFPAFGSLAGGKNVVLSYIGLEQHDGHSVQHLRSYQFQASADAAVSLNPQQLSTMDFYLDATTFLPLAIQYQMHPDNNAATNIPMEIEFSNYQTIAGVAVPLHIQRYQQGLLMIDLQITSVSFNTGMPLSIFAIS